METLTMVNYATRFPDCHPTVISRTAARLADARDALKGYNVTTGKAWSEFRGAQAASLQLPAACRQHGSAHAPSCVVQWISAGCRDLQASSLRSPEQLECAGPI